MNPLSSGEKLLEAARERLIEIEEELALVTANKVQAGPFAGMILPLNEDGYNHIANCSKILGYYEQDLHQALEHAIKKNPDIIINIGAAEGFYAIGLALRLPQATIYAFEKDPTIAAVCENAAMLNNVSDRVVMEGYCDGHALLRVAAKDKKILIVMDCEGEELSLLEKEMLQHLSHADIIVECHDFIDRTISPLLSQRLQHYHTLERFSEGPRNPSLHPLLRFFTSLERSLVMSEFRPEMMSWLVAWSRTGQKN